MHPINRMFRLLAIFLLAIVLLPVREAAAQQGHYPTHPVKLIVPLPAGSGPDIRHRLIGEYLTQRWGQQIVVENRPGGGGVIGTKAALNNEPDGYTLLVGLASVYTILPVQNNKLPFDVDTDFIPLGMTSNEGMVIAASSTLGVENLPALIELAKRRPNELEPISKSLTAIDQL